MSSKFKIGDELVCINNGGQEDSLTHGKTYKVLEVHGLGTDVRVTDDTSVDTFYLVGRFQLNTQPTAKPVASSTRLLTLPTDSNTRKEYPVLSGCLKYFPAAIAGVSRISKLGNDKHNPGEPLHHARGKSMDHGDCIIRHLIDTEDLLAAFNRGDSSVTKEQILMEANQLAWRALAYSQMINEQFGAPLAPGAK